MSEHWYTSLGEPCYTLIGRNGKERPTTLRDAKKLNLFPSVSTVIKCKAESYFLQQYRQNQLLVAAYTEPCKSDMTYEAWCERVLEKAGRHSKNARDKGADIHNALESYYRGKGIQEDYKDICTPVINFIAKELPEVDDWVAEKSFTNVHYGFGGKVDLYSPGHSIILDFKTKDKDDLTNIQPYDEHNMQTAAYAAGLELDFSVLKRYNLFISITKANVLKLTESTDFRRDWRMFVLLLNFWRESNNFLS